MDYYTLHSESIGQGISDYMPSLVLAIRRFSKIDFDAQVDADYYIRTLEMAVDLVLKHPKSENAPTSELVALATSVIDLHYALEDDPDLWPEFALELGNLLLVAPRLDASRMKLLEMIDQHEWIRTFVNQWRLQCAGETDYDSVYDLATLVVASKHRDFAQQAADALFNEA